MLEPPGASIVDTIHVALKIVNIEGWFMSQYVWSPNCAVVLRNLRCRAFGPHPQ
jgi:hypothetical protein